MIIKAKFIISRWSSYSKNDKEKSLKTIIKNEHEMNIHIQYWDDLELIREDPYYVSKLEYGELIYIDSYYEEEDEIYCNIYLDDDIDEYFDEKLKGQFREDDKFDLIVVDYNFCTLTNARELSESIIQ